MWIRLYSKSKTRYSKYLYAIFPEQPVAELTDVLKAFKSKSIPQKLQPEVLDTKPNLLCVLQPKWLSCSSVYQGTRKKFNKDNTAVAAC